MCMCMDVYVCVYIFLFDNIAAKKVPYNRNNYHYLYVILHNKKKYIYNMYSNRKYFKKQTIYCFS